MERRTLLWTLVAFFGASIAFNAVGDLTDGGSTAVAVAAQLVALAAIIALVVFLVRRRADRG